MLNAGNTISWGPTKILQEGVPRPIQKWETGFRLKVRQHNSCIVIKDCMHSGSRSYDGKRENVECRKGFRKSQDINQQRNYAGH